MTMPWLGMAFALHRRVGNEGAPPFAVFAKGGASSFPCSFPIGSMAELLVLCIR